MTLSINGKTYEAGELVAYVEKLEKENLYYKDIIGVTACYCTKNFFQVWFENIGRKFNKVRERRIGTNY